MRYRNFDDDGPLAENELRCLSDISLIDLHKLVELWRASPVVECAVHGQFRTLTAHFIKRTVLHELEPCQLLGRSQSRQ